MAIDRSKNDGARGKVKQTHIAKSQTELDREPISIDIERSGDWMPAEQLRDTAMAALAESREVIINLGKVDHLDASALQILLALDVEQKRQGRHLQLTNASSHLRQWFDYAGAADHFSMTGSTNNE
jgi:anti-anti-sigma factor